VRDAYEVEVEKLVAEYAATDRGNPDAAVLYIQFIDDFGDYLVYRAVVAAGTVGKRFISK
jgi:hypothetical protein